MPALLSASPLPYPLRFGSLGDSAGHAFLARTVAAGPGLVNRERRSLTVARRDPRLSGAASAATAPSRPASRSGSKGCGPTDRIRVRHRLRPTLPMLPELFRHHVSREGNDSPRGDAPGPAS